MSALMSDKKSDLSFEKALDRLEELVEAMESGEIPLAELVAKYEEGSDLLKKCEKRLEEAELRIEQLREEKNNTITLEPVDPESIENA